MTLSPKQIFSASIFAATLLIPSFATAQNPPATASQSVAPPSDKAFDTYHAGLWEQTIGYSQAVRVGRMLYISGTVGADAKGQPADLDGQMKKAYEGIQKTLAHYNTDFTRVVRERIYTTDIEALIRSQETRKQFYGSSAPAATWVEVRRLYGAADKIEIEVQVALE